MQQELPPTLSVMWQRNGGAQDTRGGAGESLGVLWTELAVCAAIFEELGAVSKVEERLLSLLSMTLAVLMEAVRASSTATWQCWQG